MCNQIRAGQAFSVYDGQSVMFAVHDLERYDSLGSLLGGVVCCRESAHRTGLADGWSGDSPEQIPEHLPELSPHQTVEHRVQTAVCVRQADCDWEHVGVHHVVRLIPVYYIKFDQDAPKGDGVIWHPAEKERQNHYSHRFGDS